MAVITQMCLKVANKLNVVFIVSIVFLLLACSKMRSVRVANIETS